MLKFYSELLTLRHSEILLTTLTHPVSTARGRTASCRALISTRLLAKPFCSLSVLRSGEIHKESQFRTGGESRGHCSGKSIL